jgi:sugar lactone lactonase YvrE
MSGVNNVPTQPLRPSVLVEGLLFPEAPRWWSGQLWFIDMHRRSVHRISAGGKLETVLTLVHVPSGMGFMPNGDLLIALHHERRLVRWDGSNLTPYADLRPFGGHGLNDMVVDGLGRTYVGLTELRDGSTREDFFLRDKVGVMREKVVFIGPGGEDVKVVSDDVLSPNGMVVSPDGDRLILAESRAQRLRQFTIQSDGTLSDGHLYVDLGERCPDGIALVEDGSVWVGVPLRNEFVRVEPAGQVIDVLDLGDRWGIACTLGGPDRRTLYLLTAVTTLENVARMKDTRGQAQSTAQGWVEVMQIRQAGVGWP